MSAGTTGPGPFCVMDCSILARTTGLEAQSLRELRDALLAVDPASLYYHFWGGLLRPTFDDPEYMNDFAVWVGRDLRDGQLAERLAMVDPVVHPTLEDLRAELVDLCDDRLDALDGPAWVDRRRRFYFLAADIVVIPTGRSVASPDDLPAALALFSRGAIFYHFVDARRRRDDDRDDLRAWIEDHDGDTYAPVAARLAAVDPFQASLARLRQQVIAAVELGLAEVAR
ncbi:MAG TPA: DUF5752 family protein [Candidatus Krumholzibacteria bacterium]|nr:DUF5752 family protein [Candidatus Krumholzibacteria bacterium]HPD70974.1 DUF5752 family protein [Candidatus Krumholzibacteria bacterium]HRY39326.1 DUF5752 family protein [Candidatus Krumholzibacteria bacterium]